MNASCDKASFGWPCDAKIEKLRDDFARETDPAKQKAIVEAGAGARASRTRRSMAISASGTDPAPCAPTSSGCLTAPAPVLWNIEKK